MIVSYATIVRIQLLLVIILIDVRWPRSTTSPRHVGVVNSQTTGTTVLCNICGGDPNGVFTNPAAIVPLTFLGRDDLTINCSQLFISKTEPILDQTQCDAAIADQTVQNDCGCSVRAGGNTTTTIAPTTPVPGLPDTTNIPTNIPGAPVPIPTNVPGAPVTSIPTNIPGAPVVTTAVPTNIPGTVPTTNAPSPIPVPTISPAPTSTLPPSTIQAPIVSGVPFGTSAPLISAAPVLPTISPAPQFPTTFAPTTLAPALPTTVAPTTFAPTTTAPLATLPPSTVSPTTPAPVIGVLPTQQPQQQSPSVRAPTASSVRVPYTTRRR